MHNKDYAHDLQNVNACLTPRCYTSFPLSEVVQSQDAIGRTTKWALELMDQGITYASRMAIKSQVLADFIVEWTEVQTPPTIVDQEC